MRARSFLHALGFTAGLLVCLSGSPARGLAQDVFEARTAEVNPLFPAAGRGSFSLATGIPFVGLGELAVGITSDAAIGLLVGTTPQVRAWGLRPRLRVLKRGRYELTTAWLFLHYPHNRQLDSPPWVLGRPTLQLGRRMTDRMQLGVQTGLAGAITMARIARLRGKPDYSDGAGGFRGYETKRPLTAGLWWTAGASAAVRASERVFLFAEASLVLAGLHLAESDWVGAIPTVVALGMSVSL